jgi:hypothetical protein
MKPGSIALIILVVALAALIILVRGSNNGGALLSVGGAAPTRMDVPTDQPCNVASDCMIWANTQGTVPDTLTARCEQKLCIFNDVKVPMDTGGEAQ